MTWLVVLAVLAGIGCIPLGISLAYDARGLRGAVRVGPVPVFRYPRRAKEEKPEEKKPESSAQEEKQEKKAQEQPKKSESQAPAQKDPEPEQTQGVSLRGLMPFVRLGWQFLGALRRKLVVNRLELRLELAGDDPCDLAVNYGRALAARESLMPQLERWLVIRKQDIAIACNFEASQTRATARVEITITLGRALALALVYGVRGLKEYWNWKKKPKGGAEHESETTQYAGDSHSENP